MRDFSWPSGGREMKRYEPLLDIVSGSKEAQHLCRVKGGKLNVNSQSRNLSS